MKIILYAQRHEFAGRPVSQTDLDRHDDPEDCPDWVVYDAPAADLLELAGPLGDLSRRPFQHHEYYTACSIEQAVKFAEKTKGTCTHPRTSDSLPRGFGGSVAHPPYTEENPAAHGCITYVECCDLCDAKRSVNANGMHREIGTWS